ncbi:transposase, IS4 family [Wolbachia endosymbiont of Armadillidium vulgare str. wVulC]|nr:transposase, IS4 family [Wolbachia endosymbiont of Armadillidium vulgare str. wVulC]
MEYLEGQLSSRKRLGKEVKIRVRIICQKLTEYGQKKES